MKYPKTGSEVYVSLNLSNTMLTGIGKGTITREEVSASYLKRLFAEHGVIVSAKPEQRRLLEIVNERCDLELEIPEQLKLFQLSEEHRRLVVIEVTGLRRKNGSLLPEYTEEEFNEATFAFVKYYVQGTHYDTLVEENKKLKFELEQELEWRNRTEYHVPVLLKESVDGMNIHPDGTYVDVTFGGAGHSREILSRLGEGGRLLGFDQDEDAERNIVNDPHFTFVRSNFRYLQNFLRYHDIEQVDAILADLGVSSHHFDDSERGFSFRFDGALDMRMNKRAGLTAADIVNTYEEERLANIFYLYGELKNSRKLASAIVKARNGQSIRTIGEFLEIIKPLFGREREKKELAKVFQALRIEVNQEMEALKEMLAAATEALKPGGRLVVITYHSLEDRMVKNIMKTGNVEGKAETDFFGNLQTPFRLVNNKVIVPDEAEIERNPRSRSAKLRIAEKK